ncbi:MAG: guanine deaminase [Acidimicrobiia bacterium]|nr:guanine deaminase [Acidimicrobiia bacterium]
MEQRSDSTHSPTRGVDPAKPAGVAAVRGTAFDAPELGRIRVREDALFVISRDGAIERVLLPEDDSYQPQLEQLRSIGALTELGAHEYLFPGLIDLHNHAPQWPQLGKALDVPLSVWLDRYTFPLEAKYADVGFAETVYRSLVKGMLANGTSTAVYFATVHLPATRRLAEICLQHGQRALVGRVAMDSPASCPDYYRDASAAVALEETASLIEHVQSLDGNGAGLVRPVVTPRFIPSCTDELLRGLGAVAADAGAHIQTHCSESDWAHQFGLERFGRTDTATYLDFGLLTRRSILAHSNFVTAADMELIAAAGAAVAHCPLSNFYFANAVFPLRAALERGVHVGLGTDISGGPGVSIFRAMTDCVVASRVREDGVDPKLEPENRGIGDSRVTFAEAFWLGTTGGGIALDLPIGVLSPGYAFDAVAVDARVADTDLVVWEGLDELEDIFQKTIHSATRNNIATVWVQGRAVHRRSAVTNPV